MSAGVPLSTEVDSKRVAYSSSVVDKNAANTKVRLIAQKKSIATSLFHLDLDRLKACCQMGKCLGIIYSRPNPMNAIHPLNETLCRTFLTRVQSCVNRNGLLVRHRHVHVALGAGEDALNSIPRSRSSHGVGVLDQVLAGKGVIYWIVPANTDSLPRLHEYAAEIFVRNHRRRMGPFFSIHH